MCGIGGIVGADVTTETGNLVKKMAAVLRHRGPDDVGYHVDDGVGLFNARLSIVDLGGGHQPIYNEDGTICVVFNGEIYNHQALRTTLESGGHSFSTQSDTEVIAHLYEEYGEACVDHLNGMFAFAIWDRTARTCLLARDRLGIKPLYYAFHEGQLVFGSELKTVLAADRIPRELNTEGLDLFLTLRYLPADSTMFDNIGKLLPGHRLSFRVGSDAPVVGEYWQPREQELGSVDEIEAQLEDLLRDSVRLRLMSDVPLGAFLSGGLDSSAVVGLMRSVSEQPVKTFSIGFSEEDRVDETGFARQVAVAHETEHYEVDCTASSVQALPRLLHHFDEPFADPIIVPTFEVAELARQHVKVVLTGEGADELFGGYTRFRTDRFFQRYEHVPHGLRSLIHRLSATLPAGLLNENVRRAAEMGRVSFPERLVLWVSAFDESERKMLYGSTFGDLSRSRSAVELYSRYAESGRGSEMDRMLYCETKLRLPECMLARTDRMTMAVSLEGRTPFLDHRVAELALSISHRLKIRGGQEKWLLKRALRKYVPEQILARSKQGLAVPFAYWTRSGIEDDIKRILSPESVRRRGWFEPKYVAGLLQQWRRFGSRQAQQIWSLLCLELWCRMYLDANPLQPDTPLSEVD
jgi:asparagine synthase (glutamine-hydrolysing)